MFWFALSTCLLAGIYLLAADTYGQIVRPAKTIADIKPPFTFVIKTVAPDGTPKAGVKIHCIHPRPERAEALVDTIVKSDERGIAQFSVHRADLICDRYFWFSEADDDFVGSGPVGISPVDREFEWTFKVLPVHDCRIRVINSQGVGIPQAKVWLIATDVFLDSSGSGSDKEGNLLVKSAQAKVSLAAVAPGYASTVVDDVELTKDSLYVVKLNKGQIIPGQIVDQRNHPVEGVLVQARKQALFHYCDEFILEDRTDSQGRFRLENASDGDWEITAKSQDPSQPYFVVPETVAVIKGQEVSPFQMVAMEGFRLKGKYVMKYRTEIKHYGGRRDIFLGTFSPVRAHWQERTREDGTFDIWGLPCGTEGSIDFVGVSGFHQVIKMPRDYPFFKVNDRAIRFENVPPGTYDGIEVHFLLAGRVEGTVTDASGNPLQDVEVVISPPGYIERPNKEGEFSGEVAPLEKATITVRERQDQQKSAFVPGSGGPRTLLVSEPFIVDEGEIVEKNLVFTGSGSSDRPSLVGKALPDLKELKLTLSPEDGEGKMLLVCFFDMEQRPSRYCITELDKQAEQLKQKGVTIVAVQASAVEASTLKEWVKKQSISFAVGMVAGDVEKTKFDWGVRSLPWLILSNRKHVITAEGFSVTELDKKIKET